MVMRSADDLLDERDREISRLRAELVAVEQFALVHAKAATFAHARKLWQRVANKCTEALQIGAP